jgi:hypothetical protein
MGEQLGFCCEREGVVVVRLRWDLQKSRGWAKCRKAGGREKSNNATTTKNRTGGVATDDEDRQMAVASPYFILVCRSHALAAALEYFVDVVVVAGLLVVMPDTLQVHRYTQRFFRLSTAAGLENGRSSCNQEQIGHKYHRAFSCDHAHGPMAPIGVLSSSY